MRKPGISVDIPGLGRRKISVLVSDYTGTLSLDGILSPRVWQSLLKLSKMIDIYILTADTFGKAKAQLSGIPLNRRKLKGPDQHRATFVLDFEDTSASGECRAGGRAFARLLLATQSAQAQTSSVLHAFTGGSDGARPQAGLVHSRRGGIPLNYKDPRFVPYLRLPMLRSINTASL